MLLLAYGCINVGICCNIISKHVIYSWPKN